MNCVKEEQQARDLLNWNNGIGTLIGCDLRFKINQLGCLELLDSDDEELENHRNSIKSRQEQQYHNQQHLHRQDQQQHAITSKCNQKNNIISHNSRGKVTSDGGGAAAIPGSTNGVSAGSNTGSTKLAKRGKLESGSSTTNIRQITPGSSLLIGGPNNTRRPKSSAANYQTNMLKKIELNQNSILLEKLVPKEKVDEIRASVNSWTTEEVEKFVDSIQGCSGNGKLFKSQQICGKSLLYLDQKDLLDVIKMKLGPAVKIYHAISLLK